MWLYKCNVEIHHSMTPSHIAERPGETSGDTISADEQTGPMSERRHHRRVDLRCSLYIAKSTATQLIKCITKNISSGGFYCISNEAFTNGEWLRCTIMFPDTGDESNTFALECTVEVLRVEPVGPSQSFGLACRIEDYAVVPQPRYADTIQ